MAEETKKSDNEVIIRKARKSRSGTEIHSNVFNEEYLGTLANAEIAYDIYDKMFRSDYQVKRVVWAIMSPILSATFEYVPEDDEDEEQIRQATFKNNLWNKNNVDGWDNVLIQILSYLIFGFALFEDFGYVHNDEDLGRVITMKSIGLLRQSTIREWDIQQAEIKRVRQVANVNGEIFDEWIPGDRLKYLVNFKLGDNYEGISILRHVYGNYIRKDLLLRLDMIGNEKMAIGTPVLFANKSVLNNEQKMEDLEELLSSYCGHEQQYIILDEAFKGRRDEEPGFRIEKGSYDSKSVQDAIQREDGKMMDSILASFLDIGVYRSGGNSQNEGQMDVFFNSLMSIAKKIKTFRDPIAHKYYVANYGEPKKRLDTTISGLTLDDSKDMMEVLRGYTQADIIRADDDLERHARKQLRLPKKDKKSERQALVKGDKNADRTPEGEEKTQNNPEKVKKDGK